MKTLTATQFKAQCLAMLHHVEHGGAVTITKRGRPVARLGATKKGAYASPEGTWAILCPDLPDMEPADYDLGWECGDPPTGPVKR